MAPPTAAARSSRDTLTPACVHCVSRIAVRGAHATAESGSVTERCLHSWTPTTSGYRTIWKPSLRRQNRGAATSARNPGRRVHRGVVYPCGFHCCDAGQVGPETYAETLLHRVGFLSTCTTIARAERVRRLGGFYEKNCRYAEDFSRHLRRSAYRRQLHEQLLLTPISLEHRGAPARIA
jgi:hypothetical protein